MKNGAEKTFLRPSVAKKSQNKKRLTRFFLVSRSICWSGKRDLNSRPSAWEAEKELSVQAAIPQASMFNFKAVLEIAQAIIARQKKALAEKSILVANNQKLQAEVKNLHETVNGLNKQLLASQVKQKEDQERSNSSIFNLVKENQNLLAGQNNYERFFRLNPEANKMHLDFIPEERREAARKAHEQKRLEQERALQPEKDRSVIAGM